MQASKLEELSLKLSRLRERLGAARRSGAEELDEGDELVQAARECEFMLPERLTIESLKETVDHKIATVAVLLERAHKHEALPEEVQMVADQGYTATGEDAAAGPRQGGADLSR